MRAPARRGMIVPRPAGGIIDLESDRATHTTTGDRFCRRHGFALCRCFPLLRQGHLLHGEFRSRRSLPLPACGRGIAYGFDGPIALVGKMDSENDSFIAEGVGWANSRRFLGACRTLAQRMRDTIWWRCLLLPWRRCCVERRPA